MGGPGSIHIWVALTELHGSSEKEDIELRGVHVGGSKEGFGGASGSGYDIFLYTYRKFLSKKENIREFHPRTENNF